MSGRTGAAVLSGKKGAGSLHRIRVYRDQPWPVLGGPAAVVLADVSGEALKVAEKNAENHGVKPVFCQGDLFENVPATYFDVIVSNPPYIASEEIQKLMPEFRIMSRCWHWMAEKTDCIFTEKL